MRSSVRAGRSGCSKRRACLARWWAAPAPGTYELESVSGVYNELQAGSYIFMDADYARNKKPDGSRYDAFEHALFVLASVMSTPIPERAVIDGGLKTFSFDTGVPEVHGLAGAVYERPSDEHGNLNLTACNERPGLGRQDPADPGPLRSDRQPARLVHWRAWLGMAARQGGIGLAGGGPRRAVLTTFRQH